MADHARMIADTVAARNDMRMAASPDLDRLAARARAAGRAPPRRARASADELWDAATRGPARPTPGCSGASCAGGSRARRGDERFDELFREPPFMVLEDGERALVSGLVGRIWTLRRDYPQLAGARGVPRLVAAGAPPGWCSPTGSRPTGDGGAELCSEVRVQAFGAQGRIGLAAVRPLVGRFQDLVGTEGIGAAVRLAERRS